MRRTILPDDKRMIDFDFLSAKLPPAFPVRGFQFVDGPDHSRTSTTQNYYQRTAKKPMRRTEVLKIREKLFSDANRSSLEKPLENAQ